MKKLTIVLALIVVASMLVTACGGAVEPVAEEAAEEVMEEAPAEEVEEAPAAEPLKACLVTDAAGNWPTGLSMTWFGMAWKKPKPILGLKPITSNPRVLTTMLQTWPHVLIQKPKLLFALAS